MTTAPRSAVLGELTVLGWSDFERFSLELVRQLPGVLDAHIYGVQGEAQEGIDLHVDLEGGRVRAIQCRRVGRNFGKRDAERLVRSATYPADEYWLWCTSELTTGARSVFTEHANWTAAWGLSDISNAVRGIERERARWLVEDYLGAPARKRFLGPEGDLAVMPAERWFASNDGRRPNRLSTDQVLRGRVETVAELGQSIDDPGKDAVLLAGRGGIGKTRLLRAIADTLAATARVLWLRDGVDVSSTFADELPSVPFVLLIDDAHRRANLPHILATVLNREASCTVVLATRPHRIDDLRADLHDAGVASAGIAELPPLGSLSTDEATSLAAECLDEEHQDAAATLAELTRDVPALCVLGAQLINDGDLAFPELAHHEQARRDILSRFRDELVGAISDRVERGLLTRLLARIAALQPLALGSDVVLERLAEDLGAEVSDVRQAVSALEAAGLLLGVTRCRIAPDVLGDHILYEACVDRRGPTGYADELLDTVPSEMLPNVLANLAELDWRLGAAGVGSVLGNAKDKLTRTLIEASAWDREQLLKAIEPAAAYLANWIVELARDLLDQPAETQALFMDMQIQDDSPRQALGALLGSAAQNLEYTDAALSLLWEAVRDLPPRSPYIGVDALSAFQAFGSYQAPPVLQDIYLGCVLRFLADPNVEEYRALAVELLRPLTSREGTTTRWQRHALALGSYSVNAAAAEPQRRRVREALSDRCLTAGPRTRVAAAELLVGMLHQPFGFFGQRVSDEVVRQWRPEQVALLDAIGGILGESDDPLVVRVLRDGLDWHLEYSTIHGVKSRVRRIQRTHPASSEELLLRTITHGLDEANYASMLTRVRAIGEAILLETPEPRAVLDRVDDLLRRFGHCQPGRQTDTGPLLATLAELDAEWALAAVRIMVTEPERPSALAVGVILERVAEQRPDAVRAELLELHTSPDPLLRRMAANYVGRALSWGSSAGDPERLAAIALASDPDVEVVSRMAQVAHHLAEQDPDLARAIVLAISRFDEGEVAETVCMTLERGIGVEDGDEDTLLTRLTVTSGVGHWHRVYVKQLFRRRPARALEYVFGRLDHGRPNGYDPVPFDGLGGDLLAGQEDLRAGALDWLITAAVGRQSLFAIDVAQVFWDLAGAGHEGHELIADAVVQGSEARRELALDILQSAAPFRVLNSPDWVATLLDQCPTSIRPRLREALLIAAESGSRHGPSGHPFPQDIALREQAENHAANSQPGSRAERLWKDLTAYAERSIERTSEVPEEDDE